MINKIQIRQETMADRAEVYQLIKSAFASAKHSDGNEQDLVECLRQDPAFIDELSLVAQHNNSILGYILFTQIKIGHHLELALAPLAVAPDFQSQGIGSQLILAGHKRACEMGYHYSVVVGEPEYYQRFGYLPARPFGISSPVELPEQYFMVAQLQSGKPYPQGTVEYAKSFNL